MNVGNLSYEHQFNTSDLRKGIRMLKTVVISENLIRS